MSINVNSAQASAGLLLVPMFIPGSKQTVLPPGYAHLGIPQSIYQMPNGLALVVDPVTMLKTFTLDAFDTVEVWANGKATSVSKVILPGEEQLRILLYLPLGRLVNGVNQLFYRVTRPSGNFEDSTPVLDVLYHDPAPGNPAPAGITIVFPPNIVANGVGPAEAAAGVLVTFNVSFARPFDEIRLDVGTWNTTFTVTDPSKPITLTLTAADFQQIGDNANTPVKCTVTDQLGNGNQSATTYLDIHANRLNLLAPTVKGQTGNNFNPTLQDVRVAVPPGSLLPTYKVTVKWQGATGTPAAGSFTSPQRLVSAGLEFVVPRSVLAYSLGKTVTVSYVIEHNGITTPSLLLSLNILPLPTTALIPPKIVEADANNVLDVMALGTSNATIHALLWTLIKAGQQVWMRLEGEKADGTAHNLQVWSGGISKVNATWVSQGFWPKVLVNSYLKLLGHGSTLTIKFKASLDESNNPATATVFPDRTYTIKAVELVVPTLSSVTDAGSKEVPEGGLTVSTVLKLKGFASKGLPVEIFDGSGPSAVSKGIATANPTTGIWEHTISVPVGGRRLYAQSRYHPDYVFSNVRKLTVVAVIVPTLVNVLDANNVEVPEGNSTTSTTLKLKGKASNDQQVEIFDGSGPSAVSKGAATAHATTGDVECTITVGEGSHRLYFKSLYHPTATYSNVRLLTVIAAVAPTITSVKGNSASGPEIPNGTSTTATTFVFTGKASANQKIELRDKGAVQATITVGATGGWTRTLTGQAQGAHSYTAKATYGTLPESAARTLTILPALNPGPNKTLNLVNFIVAQGRPPASVPPEAIFTQTASGGRPPYAYTSENSNVASVTSQGGTVTCRANGSTRIHVRDANDVQVFYTVTVSGIKTLLQNDSTWRTWPEAFNYCQARGGRLATLNEMLAFYNLYAREGGNVAALLGWPLIQAHPSALYGAWVADGGGGSHYYFNLTGAPAHGGNVPYGLHGDGYRRPALCLIG
ncbi:hypothetical protein PMI21_02150 [Pseudomonas sp. GM18]|uniref:C-type lectin domain-containing protein n=1 Tax=Pseudomonas sp. GM18 TaxID=1144324 RepID=UPI00027254C7|nr:C-type lectin domain-containing protein [Pseudomonas sp. GM18]EJM18578.1 hypothetical protein PMI21_02150 [Pseudomonas sp. GM18]